MTGFWDLAGVALVSLLSENFVLVSCMGIGTRIQTFRDPVDALRTGYCLTPRNIRPELHPEQGTVWKWIIDNDEQIYGQFTSVYGKEGSGALRKCSDETMEEIHKIFEVTGGKEFFDAIEQHSDRKAREMGFDGADEEYFMEVYTRNSNEHY